MKTIKSMLTRLFESKWTYNDWRTVRVHKRTGDVEYLHMDGYGNWWMDEPMFDEWY